MSPTLARPPDVGEVGPLTARLLAVARREGLTDASFLMKCAAYVLATDARCRGAFELVVREIVQTAAELGGK